MSVGLPTVRPMKELHGKHRRVPLDLMKPIMLKFRVLTPRGQPVTLVRDQTGPTSQNLREMGEYMPIVFFSR